MSESRRAVGEFRYVIAPAAHVDILTWHEVQRLLYMDLESSLVPRRTSEDLEYLCRSNEGDSFQRGHLDPNADVKAGRLRPGQMYRHSRAVLAYDGWKLIGYAGIADNSSGTGRRLKMALHPALPVPKFGRKRYAAFREVLEHPEYRDRHVAHGVAYVALRSCHPEQTAAFYSWLELARERANFMEVGFGPTLDNNGQEVPPESIRPFGADADPVHEQRLTGKVRVVRHALETILRENGTL